MASVLCTGFAALAVAGLVLAGPTAAQEGFADALSGFSSNNNDPIAIEADQLDLKDKEKLATFSGNVVVEQGEMVMRTSLLRVFYSGAAQGSDNQEIDRLEAEGGVIVTSGDQKATGETGIFDAVKDTITLSGDVVLSQGTNVLRGKTLFVDLAAGTSRMIAKDDGKKGRVQGLFTPNRNNNAQ